MVMAGVGLCAGLMVMKTVMSTAGEMTMEVFLVRMVFVPSITLLYV